MPGLGIIAKAIGIKGGIIIALGIVLAIVMWRADSLSQSLSDTKAALTLADGEIALLKADAALKEIAAAERQNDNAAVAEAEKDLLDAIEDIPDSVPDDVRVQLNCRRLRAAGRLDADLPAICRSSGGGQARPD